MDPKERLPGPAQVIDDIRKLPPGVAVPEGVNKTKDYQDWYAQGYRTRDGRTWYEFYKRGAQLPAGQGAQDPVQATIEGPLDTDQAERFRKEQEEAAKPAAVRDINGVPHQPAGKDANGRDIWVPIQAAGGASKQPPGGKPYLDEDGPQGRRLGWNPETGAYDRDLGSSPQAQAAAAGASDTKPLEGYPGWSVRVTKVGPDTKTEYVNPQGVVAADPRPPAAKPATRHEVPVQIGGKNLIQVDEDDPTTGKSRRFHVDPATGQEVLPPTPATKPIVYDTPAGRVLQPTNEQGMPEGAPVLLPSTGTPPTLRTNPQTGRLEQVNIDKDGNFVVKEVSSQTTIKPAELPVLQAKFGEISQSLGQTLAELNGKVARGEMTPEQRDTAFTAAHQQAQVQTSEINSILENSRAIWGQEVAQRGQTFGEGASRRSYAASVMGQALDTGRQIALSAGPGHGKVIGAGITALMQMGQQYAQGMGGFPSMDQVPMPAALQQARGINLPGYGPGAPQVGTPSAGTPSSGGPPGPPGPQVGIPSSAGPTASDVRLNALPAVAGGATATGAAAMDPSGPNVQAANDATMRGSQAAFGGLGIPPMPQIGGRPPDRLSAMGAQLGQGAAGSPIGSPAMQGGPGYFDLDAEAGGMMGDGSDPAWADAVRAAYAQHSRYGGV